MGWNLYNLPTGNIQLKQECTSPRTAEILRGIIITVQHIIGQHINVRNPLNQKLQRTPELINDQYNKFFFFFIPFLFLSLFYMTV